MTHGGIGVMEVSTDLAADVFKFVEKRLYAYKRDKALCASMREQLMQMEGAYRQRAESDAAMIHSQGLPGNPVGSLAVRAIILEDKLRSIEFWVQAISETYKILDERQRELVDLKYFNGLYTNEGVIKQMRMSKESFYRMRKEIVEIFAVRFGLA